MQLSSCLKKNIFYLPAPGSNALLLPECGGDAPKSGYQLTLNKKRRMRKEEKY